MRYHVEAARTKGINSVGGGGVFFSSNQLTGKSVFEADSSVNAGRTMVCYKYPWLTRWNTDPINRHLNHTRSAMPGEPPGKPVLG